jgi:hypothetical protein
MKYNQYMTMLLIAGILMITSCSEWDDHYSCTETDNTHTLYDLLANNSQTTTFAQFVKEAGYEKVLSSSQTYTVFAPTNEALQGLNSGDANAVKRLVRNHIARYSQPTSTPTSKGVRMVNGKIYYFDSALSFAGSKISEADERASNGVLHHVDNQIPYAYNLYEYIQNNAKTSKLYDFIHRFDETVFDATNSVEIDIDEQGRPIYDSIMVNYNRLLEDNNYGIGSISNEDSTYTMILPNNETWDAAYKRIAPYFTVYNTNAAYADSVKDLRTRLAIVNDLVYRGSYSNPATADSLISTTGSIIHYPSALFASTEQTKGSNGYMYTSSHLNYDNTETWNKKISVEGENQNGRNYNNTITSVFTRTVKAQSLIGNVSGDSYIEVQPISTSINPTVIFDIPNVLAGTYNVYAVFLPTTVEGETADLDSTKISFSITYLNEKGHTTTKSNKISSMMTSGNQTVKMLAFTNLAFPVSDFTDNLWLMDQNHDASQIKTNTKLSISTNVTTREFTSKTFSRTFRLDRIILEPIKN